MAELTPRAAAILRRMEPHRTYEAFELRAFVPGATIEAVREVMHELWLHRQVERSGYSGWCREQSAPAEGEPAGIDRGAAAHAGAGGEDLDRKRIGAVKPEDLFDHDSFREFFR
jgi:hypothetical protein